MFILSKTNFQDFENNVESFNTLIEAQEKDEKSLWV